MTEAGRKWRESTLGRKEGHWVSFPIFYDSLPEGRLQSALYGAAEAQKLAL